MGGGSVAQQREDLIALVDRLEAILLRSELDELEVEVGETALLLRRPTAVAATAAPAAAPAVTVEHGDPAAAAPAPPEAAPSPPRHHEVVAPLTGIFYLAPSPDAAPYVRPGDQVHTGQVIGLIEAMKLFNEIKSDSSGRVVRIVAQDGALIKAKQPLIEVDPA